MEDDKKIWNVKSKITKSTTGSVGFEYSVDFNGDVFDFEQFQEALVKARRATISEAGLVRDATQ